MLSTPTATTCIRCTSAIKQIIISWSSCTHYSGDDGATLSKNLVNFCLVTPEMTGLICVSTCMYLYWAKIDLTPAFVVLPFRNSMEYCYADGCINSSNDQATSDINLVGSDRYLQSSRE